MTDVDWELVFRYFGGECTAEERQWFERWLAADPRRQVMLDAAVAAAGRTLDGVPVSAPPLRARPFAAQRRQRTPRFLPLATAASLLLVAGGALLLMKGSQTTGGGASALLVAQTTYGARRELRLADGTRVVLGAASALRYPAAFGGGAHDASHPFRVHAGRATAEDVGTAFGVLAYAEDSTVRVVVAEGSVSLGGAGEGSARRALLRRGQLGSLAKKGGVATVRRVNVESYLGFASGRLVFDETPLTEVAAQLGRWYGTPFRIADPSLGTKTLTASFTTESLTEVLSALGPVLDVSFERGGDSVVVRRR
jgi:transmembrane sensor